jgi:energy-coupling factor transport system permease protein
VKAFVWYAGDSFLHRLNPLTKLAINVPVAVLVSMTSEIATPLLVFILAVLTLRLLGRVPLSAMLRPLLFALVFGFGVFWTSTVFYAGPFSTPQPAWTLRIGPIGLAPEAVEYGAAIALRLLAILATSMLFVLTTDPSRFVLALIHQARVSPRIAYAVFAAYRFLPLLEVEFDNIRAAHQLRGGLGGDGALPLRKLRELVGYAIPLLAIAVRKGERVALAMESRAFGALPERTYFRTTSLSRADAAFLSVALLVLGALLARVLLQRLSS